MKKSLLLGLLALSSTIFAAVTNNVDVTANLIRAVEITPQTSTAQHSLSTTFTGEYSFPNTTLEITGNPGSSVIISAPQTLTLTKAATTGAGGVSGVRTTTVTATFDLGADSTGTVSTNGTTATATQILPTGGRMQTSLVLKGSTNPGATLAAGTYSGTISIEANYN